MKIELADYDPVWINRFKEEKALISAGFPISDFIIEHIGSTAVPGLKAKPIIDILIGLPVLPENIESVVTHLKDAGYKYIEEYNSEIPERRFFRKDINGRRTHHIHIVSVKSNFWDRHIFFRDRLRNDPATRQHYELLKTELAKQEWESQNDYATAKSEFIRSVERDR